MKIFKQNVFLVIIISVIVFTVFSACNDINDKMEQAVFRSEEIVLTFENTPTWYGEYGIGNRNFNVIVQATTTRIEMDNIKNKLIMTINESYVEKTIPEKNAYLAVFSYSNGVIIIVEKTNEYNKYKIVNSEYCKLYFNFNYLYNVPKNELIANIYNFIFTMQGGQSLIE